MNKDRCTLFPEMFLGIRLKDVCHEHDIRYADKSKSRWTADLEFFNNIKDQGLYHSSKLLMEGKPLQATGTATITIPLAVTMWVGVRSFGWLFYSK